MTDNLIDMARARRVRALNSLDGSRRERPRKTRLFSSIFAAQQRPPVAA